MNEKKEFKKQVKEEFKDDFLNMKPHDERAPLHGWAPGGYNPRCRTCNNRFTGDKRAYMCADCAYDIEEVLDFCDDCVTPNECGGHHACWGNNHWHTSDGNRCDNCGKGLTDHRNQIHCPKLNDSVDLKKLAQIYEAPFKASRRGCIMDKNGRLVVEVRGWGRMVGTGDDGLSMKEVKASGMQHQMSMLIADALNERLEGKF